MSGPHAKFVKITVFECKAKGCTYQWLSGANMGQPPVGFRGLKQGKHGVQQPSLTLLCPAHGKGLVKTVTKVPVPQ